MSRKIECLARFNSLNHSTSLIKKFLIEEKLIKVEKYTGAVTKLMEAEVSFLALKRASDEEKVILVDYEWSILPKEQIRITIVTPYINKEFSFGL